MLINDPETVAQLQEAFAEYEQALVSNDVPTLDRLFWNSPHTLRYGAGENLYGFDEIQAFRNSRPAHNLERSVPRTAITTFGTDYGVANIEFSRPGSDRIGRQSQTWVRFADGWKVVAAHVSLMTQGKRGRLLPGHRTLFRQRQTRSVHAPMPQCPAILHNLTMS